MRYLISIIFSAMICSTVIAADTWSSVFSIESVKSVRANDSMYIRTSVPVGIGICAAATWVRIVVTEDFDQTRTQGTGAQSLVMGAFYSGKTVRAYGSCINNNNLEASQIQVYD